MTDSSSRSNSDIVVGGYSRSVPTGPAVWAAVALCALGFVGCGDDDAGDDDDVGGTDAGQPDGAADPPDAGGGADAAPADAMALNVEACPDSYGPASIASTFVVSAEGTGFDLNGDEAIDNLLAGLGDLLSPMLQDSIDTGDLILVAELRDLEAGVGGGADAEAVLVLYGGVDGDSPPMVRDNFTGSEQLYFAHEWVLPADCAPKAAIEASYDGTTVQAETEVLSFYVDALGGFVDIARARIAAAIEPDTAGARTTGSALFGGALKQCPLAMGDAPLGESAQHALSMFGLQPDIDLDGDGLEQTEHDSSGILRCIDGDGVTAVEGAMCGCDPKMADGYSISFDVTLVGAELLGPSP
jgi:hypothetical protein